MLASSPMIRTSGKDQKMGTRTSSNNASPGPTSCTSVSVVNGPPEVLKYRMETSPSVPSERRSGALMALPDIYAQRVSDPGSATWVTTPGDAEIEPGA